MVSHFGGREFSPLAGHLGGTPPPPPRFPRPSARASRPQELSRNASVRPRLPPARARARRHRGPCGAGPVTGVVDASEAWILGVGVLRARQPGCAAVLLPFQQRPRRLAAPGRTVCARDMHGRVPRSALLCVVNCCCVQGTGCVYVKCAPVALRRRRVRWFNVALSSSSGGCCCLCPQLVPVPVGGWAPSCAAGRGRRALRSAGVAAARARRRRGARARRPTVPRVDDG
jgi:hypothetical protein